MDCKPSTSKHILKNNTTIDSLESELYYAIAKFLSRGPCNKAFTVLKEEIEQSQIIPKRVDWIGNEHERNFDEWDKHNGNVDPTHLLKLLSRLGPAVSNMEPSYTSSKPTILGKGKQSLLRLQRDFIKSYKNIRSLISRPCGRLSIQPLKTSGPPSIAHTLVSREMCGSIYNSHIINNKFYSKYQLHSRTVGHLSAVYCMLFDYSGRYILTGADDCLVKVWSVLDGRLLGTLRGASAEISDLAIDSDNTLIAAGSCDKIIRVWSLQTLSPVAVLLSHTGHVTTLQFCPSPGSDGVLVSTGGDGCVAFWTYSKLDNGKTKFDPKPLKINEKVRPGHAQLICASFTSGGHFLAIGGADHFVRVYRLNGEDGIEKLLEVEKHQDRVDSIQFSHKSMSFASGSRDGTALIWRYSCQEWKTITLDMTTKLPGIETVVDPDVKKPQVTMVGWDRTDKFVITASNNKHVTIWKSLTGEIVHILQGHEDNIYIIEAHPTDERLIFTAGHDGQLFIWDIICGTIVKSFLNRIEGQGYGAIFDAKWSPDGLGIGATDSHGHLSLYGVGPDLRYKKIPQELFFHTDYRPLVRDVNHHVLDEQTQLAPHLMPPPFLVDMDGNPYPPAIQRLVPGREKCRDDQLVPNVIRNAEGEQEFIDVVSLDVEESDGEGGDRSRNASGSGIRPNIDEMIQRLALEQDQRMAGASAGPNDEASRLNPLPPSGDHSYAAAVAVNNDEVSPRPSRAGARRDGDVEGVRQSTGDWQRDHNIKWNQRIIVKPLSSCALDASIRCRKHLGKLESDHFETESKKKPMPVSTPVPSEDIKKRAVRKKKQTHAYSTRSAVDVNGLNIEEDNSSPPPSDAEINHDYSSDQEESDIESSQENSADDKSTDYSDWMPEAGVNLEPPKRTVHKQKKRPQRTRKKKRFNDTEYDDFPEDEGNSSRDKRDEANTSQESIQDVSNVTSEATPIQSTSRERRPRHGTKPVNMAESNDLVEEIPIEYRPPEWLMETTVKRAPYFPQMGDELTYFMQGHMLYVEAVMNRSIYPVDKRSLPWMRNVKFRDIEFVKIIGMKYEIKPPRLCCLKLGILDQMSGKLTPETFTIKYHDCADVLDFLVLKQTYDIAVQRSWEPGERFRCIIDDAWWIGTVEDQEPHLAEFPDSLFMSYRVLWDNGERERLSPWDMELIEDSMEMPEKGGSVTVEPHELKKFIYTPTFEEWSDRHAYTECDRIANGISSIMQLSCAEPFLAPVDLNEYPNYAMVVDYPMDLSTIKSRLENRFYRRLNAVQFDVRYIATNAEKFNQRGSIIVRQARIVTDLCLELIKNQSCSDPTVLYHEIQGNYKSPNRSFDPNEPSTSGTSVTTRRKHLAADTRTWKQMCQDIITSIIEREDSSPFRFPIDLTTYQDYNQVIEHPTHLYKIQQQLNDNLYDSPYEFVRNMRLIFSNSKNYNLDKRSRIYSMTVRLESFFEEKLKQILATVGNRRGNSRRQWLENYVPTPMKPRVKVVLPITSTAISSSSEDESPSKNSAKTPSGRPRRATRSLHFDHNGQDSDDDDYSPLPRSSVKTRKRAKVQYREDSDDNEHVPDKIIISKLNNTIPNDNSDDNDDSDNSQDSVPSNNIVNHKSKRRRIRNSSDSNSASLPNGNTNHNDSHSDSNVPLENGHTSSKSNSDSEEEEEETVQEPIIDKVVQSKSDQINDESEFECDDDELDNSATSLSEEVENNEEVKEPKRRGRRKGTVLARKLVLDGDDDLDQDFIVEGNELINKDVASELSSASSSTQDSDESDDSVRPGKNKVSNKKSAPTRGRGRGRGKAGRGRGRGSASKRGKGRTPGRKRRSLNCKLSPYEDDEDDDDDDDEEVTFPYKPINLDGSQVVRDIRHKGLVIGRVISRRQTEETAEDSSDSDDSDESESSQESSMIEDKSRIYNPSARGSKRQINNQSNRATKRVKYNDSDSDSDIEKMNNMNTARIELPDSTNEETDEDKNVSSRGRIRKANSMMRDYV